MPDLNATTIEAAMRIVEGTAKNMGLKVRTVPSACSLSAPRHCCCGVTSCACHCCMVM